MDTQEQQPLDELTIPARTLIHIGGMPFWVKDETKILGREGNFRLAMAKTISEIEEATRKQ